MIFAWDADNRTHIAKHGVTPWEAEEVVASARSPFPRAAGDGKFIVWGKTIAGRYLQVIFVFKSPQYLHYEALTQEQWITVEAERTSRIIFVIHAMELMDKMKRQMRRNSR